MTLTKRQSEKKVILHEAGRKWSSAVRPMMEDDKRDGVCCSPLRPISPEEAAKDLREAKAKKVNRIGIILTTTLILIFNVVFWMTGVLNDTIFLL